MMTKYVWWALTGLVLLVTLACSSGGGDSDGLYDRLYIQSANTPTSGVVDVTITLYASNGTLLAGSALSAPASIDYTANAPAGTVFHFKVTGNPASMADEQIAVRALTLDASDPLPGAAPTSADPPTDPSEETNHSIEPWNGGDSLSLALDTVVARYLEPADTDTDWFTIVLP
jgi:hypothetical protein